MKLELTNPNYCATVIKAEKLDERGLNTLFALPIFGLQALVPKTTNTGDMMILFPAETQLSHDYCHNNNLYRNSDLNKDNTKKGYIEENRRVKAIKLGGQFSTALAMPLSSLSYLGQVDKLAVGDVFNNINGSEVVQKYQIRTPETKERGNKVRGKNKTFQKVDAKLFPEHLDSVNYLRNMETIEDNEMVVVTQKLHGSSGRFSNMIINRELSWLERLLLKWGLPIKTKEYGYVAGSRRVVKEAGNDSHNHYYENSDIWNHILDRYKLQIPKNFIIYGEIVGKTTTGGDIQKGYTYGHDNEAELYVYRVVVMNEDGIGVDLSHDQMVEWCSQNGFNTVPELFRGTHGEWKLVMEEFQEVNFYNHATKVLNETSELAYEELPLNNGTEYPEEGVCIRVDGITPYILKMKNQSFLLQESKQLDTGVADMESIN